MLDGAHVLILEDEPIPALDVAMTVEASGGFVEGPAGTVAEALILVHDHDVAGAILDVNLPDGEFTPVAIFLLEHGVPIIVHSGVGLPEELRQRYPKLPVYVKPTSSDRLVEALSDLIHDSAAA